MPSVLCLKPCLSGFLSGFIDKLKHRLVELMIFRYVILVINGNGFVYISILINEAPMYLRS
jgi:hypothetical protein